MTLYAGIDVGTTSVRVGLFEGELVARAQRPLASSYPTPDRVEQDPADLVSLPVELLGVALGGASPSCERSASRSTPWRRAPRSNGCSRRTTRPLRVMPGAT